MIILIVSEVTFKKCKLIRDRKKLLHKQTKTNKRIERSELTVIKFYKSAQEILYLMMKH